MKDKRELFEVLLKQIQLEDSDLVEHLSQVSIQNVEIYSQSKEWHFYLQAPHRIHPDVYYLFQDQLVHQFSKIAKVEVWWEFEEGNLQGEALETYWQAVAKVLQWENPFLKMVLEQSEQAVEAPTLTLGVTTKRHVDLLKSSYQSVILKRLVQAQLPLTEIAYYVDEALKEAATDQVHQRLTQQDEDSLMEALEQQERLDKQSRQVKAGDPKKLIGPDIPNKAVTAIKDLPDNQVRQVIEGYIFDVDRIDFRTGNSLFVLKVTDYTSSVAIKVFTGRNIKHEQMEQFKKGQWIKAEGDMIVDNYTSELDFRPRSIRQVTVPDREDTALEGEKRVELHLHTNMSQLNATNSAADMIAQAAKWGHPAVAITDHGNVQAFPEAYAASKQHGIKVLYGMEANVVNDGEPIAYNLQDMELDQATFTVFDVETTGLSAVYDNIIEIGAVKMREGEIIDQYSEFINPGHPLSAFTTELTGITDQMVADAKPEEEVLKGFQEFCKGTLLVAHNAGFDRGFINAGYAKYDLGEIQEGIIDTLELSRLVNSQLRAHRLDTLARRYGVVLDNHHRAIYDAEATAYVALKLLEQAEDQFQMTNHQALNDQVGKGDAYKNARPYHVTLYAKNQQGLKDLFRLVSLSNIDYFFRVPRIPRTILNEYQENLLFGTACSNGEIFTAMMQEGYDEATKLVDFYDFIEIHPPSVYQDLIDSETLNSREHLDDILNQMIRLGEEHNIPVVATGNVHYMDEKDAVYREILLRSIRANANRTLHFPKVHFRTTDEMLQDFAYLGEEKAYELVVTNSQKIADAIDDVEVIKPSLYTPKIEGSDQEIRETTYQKARELYGQNLPTLVEERIEKELDSIISNGFAVIYQISQKLVERSMEDGYLVGSRGSVGSSLVATFTGITEVNPLVPHYYCKNCQYNEFFTKGEFGSGYDLPDKACPECGTDLSKEGQDIPFETFLGFEGDKVPDIDLNFSGVYQPRAHAFTKEIFGEDYVYRAGTISTVAERTAFGYVRGYVEHLQEQLPQAEMERLAKGIEGVKRTSGQHPGGIIVVPSDMEVYDFTPIQYPADDVDAEWKTTHFDFHSIEDNLLKLDILGHDDPTMIRMLQDLSGIDPRSISPVDPDVMSLFTGTKVLGVEPEAIFSETGTLGVPEFGTEFVRSMLSEARPKTFAELLQISGLSHGTNVWLGNAQDLINHKVVGLSEVVGLRDDIMVYLMQKGLKDSLAFNIMESVRRGRGLSEEWEAEMRAHNVPEWYIDSCLKIKYMFPKAHAVAYVLMALRVAYFKVHHPLYYYAAYFSVRATDFDIAAMHQGKEMTKRRIRELMDKGYEASATDRNLQTVLEIANEMMERGYSFQMVNIEKSQAHDFIIEGDTLIPPFRSVPGLGGSVANRIVEAREENPFLSKEDLQKRGGASKSIIEYLTEHGTIAHLPDEDQLSLF